MSKVSSSFEPSEKWTVEDLSAFEKEEIHKILSQDFNYLGSGAQCYAFLSADGKFVLKFFKMKHLIPKRWLKLVPIPGLGKYRFNKIDKRILRQQELFASYKMAYEELKEETGLVYIHLNKSKDLNARVKLYDRMRNCYVANLDHYEFVIQKKAQLVQDRLDALLQKSMREEAVECIHKLFHQIIHQCKKGFVDRDSGINHNYGFVEDLVVHFDSGRLIKDPRAREPAFYQREILRVGKKLKTWLEIHYPLLVNDLEEVINSVIDSTAYEEIPSHR